MNRWLHLTCVWILLAVSACVRYSGGEAQLTSLESKAPYDSLGLRQALTAAESYELGQSRACLNVIEAATLASLNQPGDRADLAALLLARVSGPGTVEGKQFLLRQVTLIAQANHVPALARLLGDEDLGQMARYALERIPGPEADTALRKALGRTSGDIKIGIINSLGERRASSAARPLIALLEGGTPAESLAAAAALGKIGNLDACQALSKAVLAAGTDEPRLLALGEAWLQCADRLAAAGDTARALAIYRELHLSKYPWQLQAPAMVGLVKILPPGEAWPVVRANLLGGNRELRTVGIGLVPQLPQPEVTAEIVNLLPRMKGDDKTLALDVLGARGDLAARPAVIAALDDPDEAVRLAAADALAKLGDGSTLPVLLNRLTGAEGAEHQALVNVLSRLRGETINDELLKQLETANSEQRRDLINILARRGAAECVPEMFRIAAGDPAAPVRAAAIAAIGQLGMPEQVNRLIGILKQASTGAERTEVQKALLAVSQRQDGDGRLDPYLNAISSTDPQVRSTLYSVLGGLGGERALAAVAGGLNDPDQEARASALRALVAWPDAQAVPLLVKIAREDQTETNRVLALRGVVRQIGRNGRPEQNLALFKELMPVARRLEDRKLVLSALGNIPSFEALELARKFLDEPDMREEAIGVILSLSRTELRGQNPQAILAVLDEVMALTGNESQRQQARESISLIKAVFVDPARK